MTNLYSWHWKVIPDVDFFANLENVWHCCLVELCVSHWSLGNLVRKWSVRAAKLCAYFSSWKLFAFYLFGWAMSDWDSCCRFVLLAVFCNYIPLRIAVLQIYRPYNHLDWWHHVLNQCLLFRILIQPAWQKLFIHEDRFNLRNHRCRLVSQLLCHLF